MERSRVVRRLDLIEPQLSYRIVGTLYEVYNHFGFGHPERVYQHAVAAAFRSADITFEEQVYVPVTYHGERIAHHMLDFLIEQRVVLELKQGRFIRKQHFDQVFAYLKAHNLSLGIIANFGPDRLTYRRVVNVQK